MINKLHKTINSLLKKDYTVEIYSYNTFTIMISFYHLNSVYNGLAYISKEDGTIRVDFQHHRKNKKVLEQITRLCELVYKLYKLNNLQIVENIFNNYRHAAREQYKNKYSIKNI